MKRIVTITALLLAGCAPQIGVNQSSPYSITLFVPLGASLQTAEDNASRHCAQTGLIGRQASVVTYGYNQQIRYECEAAPRPHG